MKTLVLAATVAFALSPVVAARPASAAVTSTATASGMPLRTFDTAFVPEYSGGAFPGVLRISISPDGIVSGYYRPIDGNFTTVTGGLDGDRIWLDLGRHASHLVGTYDGTTIRAGTLGGGCTDVVDCTYTFRADPVRS